ncbi:MAG: hypothetical protein KGL31_05755, partial [candidate division NC10 bacterium]|nr:hypothetical protein [candidate division NC10 bacterium]
HDITEGYGITMGNWCLLESSIVETSQNGAQVGHNCKVWDLVIDGGRTPVMHTGLTVGGGGTAVARTVVSHVLDGPGIDYCGCSLRALPGEDGAVVDDPDHSACQDSSNSVALIAGTPSIKDANNGCPGIGSGPPATGTVVTDCATNNEGVRYPGTKNTGPFDCGLTSDTLFESTN